MQTRRRLLSLAAIASGLLGSAAALAQTSATVDPGLGTQVRVGQTDPGKSDNTNVPILGGALLSINASGTRALLTDFGNSAQGPLGSGAPGGITWMPSGLLGLSETLLVTDGFAGSNGAGALFSINPGTGQRTLLSDFGNAAQGAVGKTPVGVAYSNGLLGLGNTIYVIDNKAGTNQGGALFAVNPSNGERTLLSDFGNTAQGPLGVNPIAIAVVPAGVLSVLGLNAGLVVLDDVAGTNNAGAVFVVDFNGNRTLLSDLGNDAQGAVAVAPQQITVTQTLLGPTTILVADNEAGTNKQGALFAIATDGTRTLTSDFGNGAQGPEGIGPSGVVATADGTGNVLVTDNFEDLDPTQAQVFLVTPVGQRSIYSDCTVTAQGPCQAPVAITQW
jgi:hypothetical protein